MKPKDFFKKIREDRQPREEFRGELRRSLMEYMSNNPALSEASFAAPRTSGSGMWRKSATITIATVVTLLTGAIGTVFASQKALPGDALYGIKLATDQLSIDITRSPEVKATIAARRINEVQQALASPSAQAPQVQKDIQSALKQYQSDTEDTVTATPTSSVVSASASTTKSIFSEDNGGERHAAATPVQQRYFENPQHGETTASSTQNQRSEDNTFSSSTITTSTASHSEDSRYENATSSREQDTPHSTSSSIQTSVSSTSGDSEDLHFQTPFTTTTVPFISTTTETTNTTSSPSHFERENGDASSSIRQAEDQHADPQNNDHATIHSSSTKSRSD